MNHSADMGLGVGRDVLVVNHILLGIFIDCCCIERDMTQRYRIHSHMKHWVLVGFSGYGWQERSVGWERVCCHSYLLPNLCCWSACSPFLFCGCG